MTAFQLPDLGEGLQDAEIVAWHVAAGDHVVADQPLVSLETDKAVVEVPSPHAGRIARLCAKPGERVKVGAALVEFEEGVHADSGTVVGELAQARPAAPRKTAPTVPPAAGAAIKASPAARARAHALGVDLTRIAPTGPDGAVTTEDIEKTASPGTTGAETLKGVRRAMAVNMARAGAEIVPATVSDDADINAWPPAEDVTVRLIRAIVAGHVAAPAVNAWYDGVRVERRLHARIDLGIAVDTEDGLIVPVLRDVATRDAGDLRRGLDSLKADVRARKVPLAELRGQTFTLSNFGMFAGRYAALVIMPPQVAILGAGRARPHVAVVDGQPRVRRMLPLSLTFDHRAVNGGDATRFLRAVITDLESPT